MKPIAIIVLTKKRLALLTVLLSAIYFVLLLFLPESVVGARAGNMLLFAPKALFLGITAAITTSVVF